MLKLIIGVKGTGKTKQLIAQCNAAAEQTKGSVVCIEKGTQLTYDIKHTVRLIDTAQYAVTDAQTLSGFISGIIASNHDVTDIFVDSTLKICGGIENFEKIADTVDKICAKYDVHCTMTLSTPAETASDTIKKYL